MEAAAWGDSGQHVHAVPRKLRVAADCSRDA